MSFSVTTAGSHLLKYPDFFTSMNRFQLRCLPIIVMLCLSCLLSREDLTILCFLTFGLKLCLVGGKTDLSFLLIRSSAGDPILSMGVFLYSRKANKGSS